MRKRVRDLEELLNVHFLSSLVQVTGKNKKIAFFGKENTIQLNISSQGVFSFPIELLSCQLMNPKSQRVPCHITHTQPGVCTLTFTPVLLGPHQLKITIRDNDIPGSPFTIRVLSSAKRRPSYESRVMIPDRRRVVQGTIHGVSGPYGVAVSNLSSAMRRPSYESRVVIPDRRRVVQGTIHGVSGPYGVAVSNNGEVVVSEYINHCISVYSREGKKIRSFGSKGPNEGQFIYPHGVAITSDNHILISDEHNHRIQMFTIEGRFVKSVGQERKRQLQFDHPSGIAVHPSGKVFIADMYNHRIQVLNSDLSYSHMFGSNGNAPGQFSYPYGVAINRSGVVYVTD